MTAQQAVKLALDQFNAGRFAEADQICRQILARRPNDLDALQLQSLLEAQANRLDSAIELIRRVISLNPNVADYFLNLGELQRRAGSLDAAVESLRRAIDLRPNNAIAHFNLGVALADKQEATEALAEFRRAILINPNFAEAHLHVGNHLRRQHQFDGAGAAYRRAIEINPDFAEAHWNYSLLLLQTGDLENGWREYEWRRRIPLICPPRNFARPEWTGEPLHGETVFLHIEQAFGDVIHFARFAPMVAKRGGRVVLQSPPELVRILGSLKGAEQIVATDEPIPPFDLHAPLLSLGRIFAPRLERIPAPIPYLHADPKLVERWRARLEPHRDKFKVGLVHSGRQMLMDGGNRSIPTDLLAPLFATPNTIFVGLQPDVAALPPMIDFSNHISDFADTAALMANLDLIITIDSAPAHLAGALGRPTWTLLLYDADWRWLLDRSDSPWYPTMRLFRQPAAGDWTAAMQNVDALLPFENPR